MEITIPFKTCVCLGVHSRWLQLYLKYSLFVLLSFVSVDVYDVYVCVYLSTCVDAVTQMLKCMCEGSRATLGTSPYLPSYLRQGLLFALGTPG